MNPILLNPKIDSSASTTEQLNQMKSYLRQFKEEVEMVLSHIDSDNVTPQYEEQVFEGFSKKLMGSKAMSEIVQSEGMIRMSVKSLEGNMSSLTLTVDGIQSEVYDSQGNSRITQVADEIALCVTKENIVGDLNNKMGNSIFINKDYIIFDGDGSLIIDMTNLSLDSYGNATFGGTLSAPSGNIGGFEIDSDVLQTDPDTITSSRMGVYIKGGASIYPNDPAIAVGYSDPTDLLTSGFRVTSSGSLHVNYAYLGHTRISDLLADAKSSPTSKYPVWKQLSSVGSSEYVLTGASSV